jgi:hypothetical protein
MEQQDYSLMKKLFTTQTFASTFGLSMVIRGYGPIPTPIDEFSNLELFTFNKKKKQVIMQKNK